VDTNRFRALAGRERALVAVAVLLDGREAATYLENDAQNGQALKRAADSLSAQEIEYRMAYASTMLRAALEDIE